MIAIVNIGPAPGNKRRGSAKGQPKDPLGPHLYQVRINTHVEACFTHARGESLATCLRLAAAAVEQAKEQRLITLTKRLHDIETRPPHASA